MWSSLHQKIVGLAGGHYKGTQSGLVWFNAPSGSTLTVREDDLSIETVRARLTKHEMTGGRVALVLK